VVAALTVGSRKDYGKQALLPHDVSYVLLGAGLLWFGWFGFNGGSALAANGVAALAFVNTLLAPAAALTAWMLLDLLRSRKATAVGAGTGVVVGLVAITPAAGFVSPLSAMAIGALAAVPSHALILYRSRTALDDSLDVFAAHGTGGITGALLTGVFAQAAWGGTDGLLFGNPMLVARQAAAIAAAGVYSGLATFAILRLIAVFMPLRTSARNEGVGLDLVEHGEEAYARGDGAVLVLPRRRAADQAGMAPDYPRPPVHLTRAEAR
jgi:Amt family ammonium transporter